MKNLVVEMHARFAWQSAALRCGTGVGTIMKLMSDNTWLMTSASVVGSAMLTIAAFYMPYGAGPLVFCAFSPLAYAVLRRLPYSCAQGFLWGILFFTAHGYAVIRTLLSQSGHTIKYCALGALIIFYALTTAAWFFVAGTLAHRCNSSGKQLAIWCLVTAFFFWWQNSYLMWIVGIPVGYPFSFLLLPLCAHPPLLWMLPYLNEYGVLFLVLSVNAALAGAWVVRRQAVWLLGYSGLIILFFLAGFLVPTSPITPGIEALCKNVAYCAPPDQTKSFCALDYAQEITYALQECVARNPDAELIVMPESTFPFALNEHQYALELWTDFGVGQSRSLLLGAHRRNEHSHLFNTIFMVKECRITHAYDKRWCVPFYEYIPSFWQTWYSLCRLFLPNNYDSSVYFFSCGSENQENMPLTKGFVAHLFLCSELFIAHPRKQHDVTTLRVCLMNDAWCAKSYYASLMELYARYSALKNNSIYWYVGHTKSSLFFPSGQEYCCS